LIDFRYHLVSIVSVFLALAIGIVVGALALSPDLAKTLNHVSAAEAKANHMLYTHNGQLKDQIAADQAFAQAAEGGLLRGLLADQHVVLVLAPGADSTTVDGVTSALRKSGAVVTGQVVLTQQFFDTGSVNEHALKTAATNPPPGIAPPSPPSNPQISGQQAAAQLIAAAIVNKDGVGTVTAKASQQVLTKFGKAGFVQVNAANGSAALAGEATMAVVVIPATVPPATTSGPFDLALISVAQDLQQASRGALLAGSLKGSGPHSAIDAVASGNAGVKLMTVDNAETVSGQIMVAQALNQLLAGSAAPTAYGVRPRAVPSPAPSASPSPSVTSSHPTRKAHPTRKKTGR
jgi:copper transport outer membrane protein MctB